MKNKLFFAVAFLVVGMGLFVVGRQEANKRSRIEQEGTRVKGVVLGIESRRARKATLYDMNVAYEVAGAVQRKKFAIPRGFAEKHLVAAPEKESGRALVPNATVEIRYLPGNPSMSVIVGADVGNTTMAIIGAILAVVGAGLGVWAFAGRKKTVSIDASLQRQAG